MKIKLIILGLALAMMSAFAFSPRQAIVSTVPVNVAHADYECGSPELRYDPATGLCVYGRGADLSVNQLIIRIINVLLAIAFIIAVLFLVIGGYQYMTSAGNEELAGKGKKTIINALIGIIVIVLAYVIVSVVANAVSGTASSSFFGF